MPQRPVDLSRDVASVFAEARMSQGVSMEELADAVGLHRTTIGLIERGQRAMTLDVAFRLAQGLGLQLSQLVAAYEQRHLRD